jgi:hypothetical protein
MMAMLRTAALLGILLLLARAASGQSTDAPNVPPPPSSPAAWAVVASAMAYLVPDAGDYLSPTVTADRGRLHLEARSNYEGLSTGSAWIGYNISAGDTVKLELTPMVAGVFGDTTGLAPGLRGTLGWRRLELYTESEIVFDLGEHGDSFIYTWTELTYSPVDWFRFGAVAQRTRAYASDLDIQRGVLAGFSYRRVDVSAHAFNWGWTEPTYVFSVAINF